MKTRVSNIKLPLDHTDDELKEKVAKRLKIGTKRLIRYSIHKQSVDARKKNAILLTYTLDVEVSEEGRRSKRSAPIHGLTSVPDMTYYPVTMAPENLEQRPVIVGAGPCGLFAALALAEMGFRPILLERGQAVDDRVQAVSRFWEAGELDPASNVAFGEGGAGTFSDGKLYTQIKDSKFRMRKILTDLVRAGAPQEILYSHQPHIGTDRLISVVRNLRGTIGSMGGTVRFESQVTDLLIEDRKIRGLRLADGEEILTNTVILAIGHSARDTFTLLHEKGVSLEPKPFSIGLRIEHPQTIIDTAQFGTCAGHPRLGPASYKLVHHRPEDRSVYSFCMCPGGQVIGSASEPGSLVVNGMSAYARDLANANSGLLVGVKPEDYPDDGPLAGVAFQRYWEQKAFELGEKPFYAPAQRVEDFLQGRPSSGSIESLPVQPSHRPGVTLCDLADCLPPWVTEAIREAIPALDKKIEGFALPDAMLTGVETRSSSPLRILRDGDLESLTIQGLFPAGEGAGYAGGILSSAVDGIKVAEKVALRLSSG